MSTREVALNMADLINLKDSATKTNKQTNKQTKTKTKKSEIVFNYRVKELLERTVLRKQGRRVFALFDTDF